jgi:phosphinothricin acetyltransferase
LHQIRPASASDLPELVRIYNHYITSSHVTFDLEPFAVHERRGWFEEFADSGPFRLLVAESDAKLVGYASSTQFRPKPGYFSSVETTIYVAPTEVGAGLGRELYGALLDLLADEPEVHRAYGGVALPNPASVALHERLGFRLAGTFDQVGRKFDQYWDVSWYEKRL